MPLTLGYWTRPVFGLDLHIIFSALAVATLQLYCGGALLGNDLRAFDLNFDNEANRRQVNTFLRSCPKANKLAFNSFVECI